MNLGALESTLVKDLVSAEGVETTLHRRHHKLLRTPKVIRQQAVKSVISVLKTTSHYGESTESASRQVPRRVPVQEADQVQSWS